jgi:ABC-2 type transport system permease protein
LDVRLTDLARSTSLRPTLDYCSVAFSPFQLRQLRIVEFPRYSNFAGSFPNTIPFS